MGLKILLLIGWILAQTQTVNSQCYSEIQTSTITKSNFWEKDVIYLGELMESLLDYIRLAREQVWIVDNGMIISQTGDRSCALLSEGLNLDELDVNITQNWALHVMTSALVVHDKILVTSKSKSTLVTKTQFTHLAQLLGMNDKIDLTLDPHIVFLLSGTERILTNF